MNLAERSTAETRQWVDDDHGRLELVDVAVHGREMHLQPIQRRTGGMDAEQTFPGPALQVDADRAHIAGELCWRFLEHEARRALPAATGRLHEVAGHAGLARAGSTGEQHAAPLKIAAAVEHSIEPLEPRRDVFGARGVLQLKGCDRK